VSIEPTEVSSVVVRYDVVCDVDIIFPPWFTDLLFLGRPIRWSGPR
jgi:hypothetical protein